MRGSKWDIVLAAFVVVVVVITTSAGIGRQWGQNQERNKAIEAGVGKWTVDEKTGNPTFVYGRFN